MEQTYKQLHVNYLKHRYGKNAAKWANNTVYDDRVVYCNIYRQMLEALESLPDNPNNYVCVALNWKMKQDCDTLDEIARIFFDR